MKKRRFIVLTTMLLLLTGCSLNKISYEEDSLHNNMEHYTYKFIGESKHFYFQTGKVYYDKSTQALLMSNFKAKKSLAKNAKCSIQLYFNDKLLYSTKDSMHSVKELEKIVIAESGNITQIDAKGNPIGESDAFLETKKDTFKESIKVIAKYCVKNDCKEERFTIKYLK